ncbi:hypothetical protein [Wolbachia endosymbiont of Tetranychus urticae]|uniref:hypothetical protein n=1 Tax=Wolbachia endosymbiont of Tetranychus urticae TaxID=169184 RepID=UPI00397C2A65
MSNTSILQKILYRIDNDDKISASNIIEKLKSELQQHVNMYNTWEESGFDINANSFDGSNLYQFPLCKEQIDNNGKEVILE